MRQNGLSKIKIGLEWIRIHRHQGLTPPKYSKFEENYSLGLVSSIEFRQAQTNLLKAELSLNNSTYETKITELVFLKLTGEIIDNY